MTPDTMTVLLALIDACEDNDGDFGYMDEALAYSGFEAHKFAGHVAHLQDYIIYNDEANSVNGVFTGIYYELTESAYEAAGR